MSRLRRTRLLVCAVGVATRAGGLLPLEVVFRLYKGSDKHSHGYTPYYSVAFSGLRYRRNRVLEIGVGGYWAPEPGGSLRIWRDYFAFSKVAGLDVFDKEVRLGSRVSFVRGDQANPDALGQVVDALGGAPNIVIDDGSHRVGDALASFRVLFPLMPAGSVYCIEDLHTSYWDAYGGAVPPPGDSAVALVMDLVTAVQVQDVTFAQFPDLARAAHWARDVASLEVFPGLAIIRKV